MAGLTKERVTHVVTPLQTPYETHPVTLFVQVSKTKTKTKYLYLAFRFSWLLKKLGFFPPPTSLTRYARVSNQ